jgi:zinc/manganese transport system substrate-binding protein
MRSHGVRSLKYICFLGSIILVIVLLVGCQPVKTSTGDRKTIIVTYSVLGSLVKELVADQADVVVTIPNGQDPHDWSPSPRDVENINNASLVVCNGLGLESGLTTILTNAQLRGIPVFTGSDYITVRYVGVGEGIPTGDPDQTIGAADPHIWTDPLAMRQVVAALALRLKTVLNIDTEVESQKLQDELTGLDQDIRQILSPLALPDRKLVTGHESLGYFAERYDFKLIGAIVPSISTQAGVSASDLAALKILVQKNQVKAIFTELGTSAAAAEAIGKETGVKVVELNTHKLPSDGQYTTFMKTLALDIVEALK